MGLPDAAVFLLAASVRNRVRRTVRRLREPRYALFLAAGVLYFYSIAQRRFTGLPSPARPGSGGGDTVMLLLGLGALLFLLGGWIFGGDAAALQFSEAEVQLLFPAPVTRRALVHYRLLRALAVSLTSAVFITLLRRRGGSFGYSLVGTWLGLGTLSLHWTGAALTRASLAEHGVSGWRRRLGTLAVIAALGVALAVWAARSVSAFPVGGGLGAALRWGAEALRARPLSWVLAPVMAPLRVMYASDGAAFLRALPAALAVVGVHYVWAISSSASFEEAAAEAATRRAARLAARRAGRGTIRRVPPPFRLGALGRPATAIFWKNLVASARVVSPRLIIAALVLVVMLLIPLRHALGDSTGHVVVTVCIGLAALVAFLGPQAVGADLRLDLPQMDLLRSFPLAGRQVVAAEVLAPAVPLVLVEAVLILAGVATSLGVTLHGISVGARLAIAVTSLIALASLTVSSLVLRNAFVLYLPDWSVADGESARGPEAIGRRLVGTVGLLIVLALVMLPASAITVAVLLVARSVLGSGALVVGALAGGALVAVEIRLALGLLGRAFERFDLSRR